MEARLSSLAEQSVCIVGLGLMGGSAALALRSKVRMLRAVDPKPEVLDWAGERGLVDLGTPILESGAAGADLVILAAPVRSNLRTLARLPAILRAGALVMDFSSTKVEIVEAMDRMPHHLRCIGGHPMCGKEQGGIEHADADLFRDQVFVLCPTARTDSVARTRAREVVAALHARPVELDPESHDRSVGQVSHLPYLLAAALVHGTAAEALALAASGYRDTSRLAASQPEMMLDVLLTNRASVLVALERAGSELATIAELLQDEREADLRAYLEQAQAARVSWERTRRAHQPVDASRGRS